MPSPFVIRGDQLKQKKQLKPLSFLEKTAGIKLKINKFIKIVQVYCLCSETIRVINLTGRSVASGKTQILNW
jgi:hypothetical protein